MTELFAVLFAGAVSLGNFPTNIKPPEVLFLSREAMNVAYCGEIKCSGAQPVGLFKPTHPGVVAILDDFDPNNAYQASVIVHEFAHHLQLESGKMPVSVLDTTCKKWLELEMEALDIQEKWLNKHSMPTAHFNRIRAIYQRSCPWS